LIFTQRILKFYFDFFMRRAVLLLPALLCAARKRKFTRQIQTLCEGNRFTASKPLFRKQRQIYGAQIPFFARSA